MNISLPRQFNLIGLSAVSLVAYLFSATVVADTRLTGFDQAPLAGLEGSMADLTGIWSVDCADPGEHFTLFNYTHVMIISGTESATYYSSLEDSWANDDRIQLSPTDDELVWTFGSGEDAEVYEDELCAGIPPTISALHGEAITFFQQSDALVLACSESGEACIETFFEQSDMAGTGGINEADLARLIRIGTYFGTLGDSGEAEFSDLAVAQAASVALAPLAANLLIRSFDYDGDGQLSIAEVAADRDFFAADNLSPMTGAAADLEDSLRSSVQQLQQLLMILQ